ncbi:hypothetical protein A8E00_06430, partial [Burkholderia cenocepacia]
MPHAAAGRSGKKRSPCCEPTGVQTPCPNPTCPSSAGCRWPSARSSPCSAIASSRPKCCACATAPRPRSRRPR